MRLFATRSQIALRVGPHWVGIKRGREYWSERNRIGWHIRYLPLGWRAFYKNWGA